MTKCMSSISTLGYYRADFGRTTGYYTAVSKGLSTIFTVFTNLQLLH